MECKSLLKMGISRKKVDSEHADNCHPAAVHATLTLQHTTTVLVQRSTGISMDVVVVVVRTWKNSGALRVPKSSVAQVVDGAMNTCRQASSNHEAQSDLRVF
jgi:hypothetical protein